MRSGLNIGEIIRVGMVPLIARHAVKSGINLYSLASIMCDGVFSCASLYKTQFFGEYFIFVAVGDFWSLKPNSILLGVTFSNKIIDFSCIRLTLCLI